MAVSKAVCLLGIALALGVVVVAGVSTVRLMQDALQAAYAEAENRSAAAAAHASQVLTAAIFITDNLVDQLQTTGRSPESFREEAGGRATYAMLRSLERSFPAVDAVSIFDANGQMVSTSRQFPAAHISIADREAFQVPKGGRRAPHIATAVKSRSTGAWTFYVTRRLESDTGEFLGVSVVGLSAKYFARFYEEVSVSSARPEGWSPGEADATWLVREDAAVLSRGPFAPGRLPERLSGINVPVTEQTRGPSSSVINLLCALFQRTTSTPMLVARRAEALPVYAVVTVGEERYRAQWRAGTLSIWTLAGLALALLAGAFAAIFRMLRRREDEMAANHALRLAADSSNRAKSEFLATMSHEIRTPLNGLLGTADLLGHTRLDAQQGRLLNTLIGSGRLLLGIMDDILDLSKIEAGELRLGHQPFCPAKLARGVAELFTHTAMNKGVRLTTQVSGRVPSWVLGDAARIQQVLVNLVSNAVKFTDTGTVAMAVDAAVAPGKTAKLHFEVRDTGCGIPAEARDRIFLPFTQADGSVSRRFGGTGLGLTISRRLVEMMGGTIDFQSSEGAGTSFWFDVELPVVESSAAEEPSVPEDAHVRYANAGATAFAPARDATHQGRHVLLVEDDAVNAMIAEAQLNQLGCSCVVAFNGEEALAQLGGQAFDLVLMDCMLPGMSGYDVTRAWRAKEAQQGLGHVPIVALTANALSSNVEQCRQAGMDDFLTKPCTVEKLANAFERWLVRTAARDTSAEAGLPSGIS